MPIACCRRSRPSTRGEHKSPLLAEASQCPFGGASQVASRQGGAAEEAGVPVARTASNDGFSEAPSLAVLRASTYEGIDGFLSEEFGFCNCRPIPPLPADGPHALWEELGRELAEMNRSGDYSRLEAMPELDASDRALPSSQLKRAAMLLGVMAHSWAHMGPGAKTKEFPPGLLRPWEAVSLRMGRPAATMTYQDYFVWNLAWRDDVGDEQREFSDSNVLTDTEVAAKAFGQGNELAFIRYNFAMDWFSRGLPLDAAKAQQAVLDEDDAELVDRLVRIRHHIEALIKWFSAINPHPSAPDFVCPVVWSKTIGKIIPPARRGELSLSGLQNSSIHLVDILLGRVQYTSELGQLALDERKGWLPSSHLQLFEALSQVSVRDYVERHQGRGGGRRLRRMYNLLVDLWTGPGEKSWMYKHRLKMADFLELGMKTSRETSSGGTASASAGDWQQTRTWEKVDAMCVEASEERFESMCIRQSWFVRAIVCEVSPIAQTTSRVSFDVSQTGLSFKPGDRVSVQPRNPPDKILRTIRALDASSNAEITLNHKWLLFAERLGLHVDVSLGTMPLHVFLDYAALRPLSLSTALGVMSLLKVHNFSLLALVTDPTRLEKFEFWDFLLVCRQCEPAEELPIVLEFLSEVLPPLEPRQYSAASSDDDGTGLLQICVGRLWYSSDLLPEREVPEDRDRDSPLEGSDIERMEDAISAAHHEEFRARLVAARQSSVASRPSMVAARRSSMQSFSPRCRSSMVDLRSSGMQTRNSEHSHEEAMAKTLTSMQAQAQKWKKWGESKGDCEGEDHDDVVLNKALAKVVTPGEDQERWGVCSNYLLDSLGRSVHIQIEHAEHFHMPRDLKTPIVMFCLGTGAAPFQSFVRSGVGRRELWLFWGIRTKQDLFCWDDWAQHVVAGSLNLRLAFSKDLSPVESSGWPDAPKGAATAERWTTLTAGMQTPGHLDTLMEQPESRQALASLVLRGADFYACGQPQLGEVAMDGLVGALQASGMGEAQAKSHCYALVAEGRIHFDLFSSSAPGSRSSLVKEARRSEVARHCHTTDCWTIFHGRVYDITRLLLEHPGGPKILLDKAGRDCTADFNRAHALSPRVAGMFAPHYVAPLRASVQPADPPMRQRVLKAMLRLVDQLLEACNVLRADWNRFDGLPQCMPRDGETSLYRDREVHRRFASTTAPLVHRCLREALATCRTGSQPVDTTPDHSGMPQELASMLRDSLTELELGTSEDMRRVIEQDMSWSSCARDGAIDLLAELEEDRLPTSGAAKRLSHIILIVSVFPLPDAREPTE